jgi:hypothetical protein
MLKSSSKFSDQRWQVLSLILRSPSGSGKGVLSRKLGRAPPMQNLACLPIHKKEKRIMFSRCDCLCFQLLCAPQRLA